MVLHRFENTGLSTLSPGFAQLARERGIAEAAESEVSTIRLRRVLEQNAIDEVHFLSIDVEGWELPVLRGIDLSTTRPWVICIEAITPGTDRYCGTDARELIESAGYVLVLFDGVNDWFVATERQNLIPALRAGLSAVDRGLYGWKPYETDQLEKTVTALTAEHDRLADSLSEVERERERLVEDSTRAAEASADERSSLKRRRALIESRRQTKPVTALPIAQPEGASSVPVDGRAVTGGHPQPRLSARVVRRLARTVVPRSVVSRVRKERDLRRFVAQFTAPSFIAGRQPAVASPKGSIHTLDVPHDLTTFGPLSPSTVRRFEEFLRDTANDRDTDLSTRLDRAGDRIGTIESDVRTSLALAGITPSTRRTTGTSILFDARSLQVPGYRNRGIGVFAMSVLDVLGSRKGRSELVLLVDPFEDPLDASLSRKARLITSLATEDLSRFGLFVQPSPMTHDVAPLLPILDSDARTVAVVYDFIPGDYPDVYVPTGAGRLRYGTQLRALEVYDEFLPISRSVEADLHRWIPSSRGRSTPCWPRAIASDAVEPYRAHDRDDVIVIFGADEPRKNTLAALAGLAAIGRVRRSSTEIVVLGLAGHDEVALHWAELAGFAAGEVTIAPRLSEAEKSSLLKKARLVLVPSFAEGLSLPVIEAVMAGAPVVASAIDAHRDLLGNGPHLADPARADAWARAIRSALKRAPGLTGRQAAHFRSRLLPTHDEIVSELTPGRGAAGEDSARHPQAPFVNSGARLSIGIATPWPRQRTGVADYSRATLTALARIADVTAYVTSGATKSGSVSFRDVARAYETHGEHDAFVSVLGNSSFHLPMMMLAERIGGITLNHDSRMVEYYLALHGETKTGHLMGLRGGGDESARLLREQLNRGDYSNLGFGHIAGFSSRMLFHSPAAAARVQEESGGTVGLLPFVPLRQPRSGDSVAALRSSARAHLRFRDDEFHIVSLGIVDSRMKLHDHVLEAAMWTREWGLQAHLHFVGGATDPSAIAEMTERSKESGVEWFRATGHVTDATMRHYLSAADLVIQLRAGSTPMLSAPIADAAAFGSPSLASPTLLEDDALPDFISATADAVSPLTLAEQIVRLSATPHDLEARERSRRDYLRVRNSAHYARALLEQIEAHR